MKASQRFHYIRVAGVLSALDLEGGPPLLSAPGVFVSVHSTRASS